LWTCLQGVGNPGLAADNADDADSPSFGGGME